MKQQQLKELIKGIVHQALQEYSGTTSLSSSDMRAMKDSDPNLDPSIPPEDAMSPIEKSRLDRETEMEKQKQIKSKEQELKTTKKELEFQKQKIDQQKRFSIPSISKELNRLKGANI